MGRLKTLKKYVKPWLLPALASLLMIAFVHLAVFRSSEPSRNELNDYVNSRQIVAGDEVVDGYQQVYYIYKNVKIYVTNGKVNHFSPVANGRYVVWLEQAEGPKNVVLYDVLEKTKLQLSFVGVNFDADINDKGEVTWQRIVTTKPQHMHFDGISVRKL